MPTQYINVNGTVVPRETTTFSVDNRAFRYGDGLFETMLWKDGDIRFIDLHLERLHDSMRMLQLEDVDQFNAYFLRSGVEELLRKNNMIGQQARVRFIVYRQGAGLYSPENNRAGFVIQVDRKPEKLRDSKTGLIVDVYTQYTKPFSELSKIKSNNALIYVMAGIYKKKEAMDEVFILNQKGNLCEGLTSNVFVYYEKVLYTPALSEGCISGTMRRVVMDMAEEQEIPVVEAEINPEIMKVADEIFCTNAVDGIQWVMGYKHKRYFNKISRQFQERLRTWSYEDLQEQ